MPLSQRQLEALETMEWMVGGQRRSGRTFTMAVAAIRVACRSPGVYVQLFDHHPSRQQESLVARYVESLVRSDPRLAPYYAVRNNNSMFRLGLPQPIQNWLPIEEFLDGPLPSEEILTFNVDGPAVGVSTRQSNSEPSLTPEVVMQAISQVLNTSGRLDRGRAAHALLETIVAQESTLETPLPRRRRTPRQPVNIMSDVPKEPDPPSRLERLLAADDD